MKADRQLTRKRLISLQHAFLFFILLISFGIAHADRYYAYLGGYNPIGTFGFLAEAEAALRNSDSPERQNLELKETYPAGGYVQRIYWNPTVQMQYGPWAYSGYGSEGEAYSAFVQNALRAGMCTMEGQPVNDWTEHGETGPYGNPGPGELRQRIYNFFGTWSWATNPPCTMSGWVQYWGMKSSRKISCPPRTPNYIFRSEPAWPDWHCSSNVTGLIVDTSPEKEECKIPPLTPLPKDQCNQALENGRGMANPASACLTPQQPPLTGRLLSEEMTKQEQCLIIKLAAFGIPYVRTAAYRTNEYQLHLWEIWNRSQQLVNADPIGCAELEESIAKEKKHGIGYRPAKEAGRHTTGDAIDISGDSVNAFKTAAQCSKYEDINTYIQTDTYINGGFQPACNLTWGGTFREPDKYHFQLR